MSEDLCLNDIAFLDLVMRTATQTWIVVHMKYVTLLLCFCLNFLFVFTISGWKLSAAGYSIEESVYNVLFLACPRLLLALLAFISAVHNRLWPFGALRNPPRLSMTLCDPLQPNPATLSDMCLLFGDWKRPKGASLSEGSRWVAFLFLLSEKTSKPCQYTGILRISLTASLLHRENSLTQNIGWQWRFL